MAGKAIMNHTPITENNSFNTELEWRRCLIWLAIQAEMFTDAALMAVYNNMLPDEHVAAYYQAFAEFRSEVRRIARTPKDWND